MNVPHFIELSASRVYQLALRDGRIRDYLPDPTHEKPINREYLFNVSVPLADIIQIVNTVDPTFFETNIPEAFRVRKVANAESQNKMVEVLPFFLDVIKNSNMINNGKFLVKTLKLLAHSHQHWPLRAASLISD